MTGQNAIRLDWCSRDDIPQVQELIGQHWRAGHILARDAALYAWQFHDRDRPERLSALLARRGHELVGHLGLVPGDFNLAGRRLPGRWTSLWFVAKEAQAIGAGVALLRKAQEDIGGLVGCLGYNQQAQRAFGAMGFALLPALPRWLRLGQKDALASLMADAPQPYAPSLFQDLAQAAASQALLLAPDLEVLDWADWGPDRWQKAWQVIAAGGLGSWLDTDFITWRYLHHPIFCYNVRLARSVADGQVQGLMVYRLQEIAGRPEKVLRLLELLCLPEATDTLLADLMARAAELRPAFVDFHCVGQELAPALRRAGFVREDELPQRLPSLFQPLDFRQEPLPVAMYLPWQEGSAQEVLDSPRLYLTRGQGDQDRPN